VKIRQAAVGGRDATFLVPLAEIEPQLVLAFGAPRFFEEPGLAEFLGTSFPRSRCVGCSTAGEISSKGVSDGTLVVTAVSFERPDFSVVATPIEGAGDSHAAGARLAARLGRPVAAVVLGQGVDINGSALIAGMAEVLGAEVAISGGLAGDGGAFRRTWVLADGVSSGNIVVAIGFGRSGPTVSSGSAGGWKPFGPARRATRAVGNVLFEVDGEPALQVYKRYLGDYAKDLPSSGLLFPLALLNDDRSDTGVTRTLLGIDEEQGSITLAGDVAEGGYLRLMHAGPDALVDGAEAAARIARSTRDRSTDSLALLFSCVGRKLVFGDAVEEEVEAVSEVLGDGWTLAGFYSNGEIGPSRDPGSCRLHNQTMTVTCVSES
jgi:hypothetical protein